MFVFSLEFLSSHPLKLPTCLGTSKITSTSTEGQKLHENLAPVLVIISGKSLVFSRKIITSTGFYRYCAPDASAPVVVINESPIVIDFFTSHPLKWPLYGLHVCMNCLCQDIVSRHAPNFFPRLFNTFVSKCPEFLIPLDNSMKN